MDCLSGSGGDHLESLGLDQLLVGSFQFFEQVSVVDSYCQLIRHRLEGSRILFRKGLFLNALNSQGTDEVVPHHQRQGHL